ncbi:hypothetical protein AAG570_010910 [Ranatra chinensis]|uniref:Uncharacterized protein n=1 Tax=Ranatra chinensis TaxID=642074 RepID=A0ABD0YVB2_9HEMI
MASKRRNMFHKNKTQETTENGRTKTQSASSSSSNIRRLEESYQALVKTCQAAEVRCTRLVEEREKQELGEKNLLLEQFARKECEYERKLSEAMNNIKMMETRSAQYTKSFTDLTEMLTKLQEENKVVGSLRENQGKLKVKVHELTQENHKLHTENQLMILEREKNKVLLQIKDQEINKLKNDIQSWQKVSKIPSEPAISRQAERQERNGHETEAKCGKRRRKLPLDHEQKDVKTTGGGGGMECIEVLKAQLQGFVDNMKEQLQLGNQCLTVENRDTQEQSSGHDSSQSLCSLAMSEFSDTVRAPQPECNPGKNNSSYIDLSPYKNTGW